MNKIFITLGIFIGIMITLPTNADVGEAPAPGGLITVGDKTNEIQMKSETVTFDIRENDGTFNEYTEHYAHVTAQFTMVNLTNNEITKQLVFPFHYAYLDYFEDTQQAVLTYVQINGDPVNVDYAEYTLDTSNGEGYDTIISGIFDATFAANTETDITIEYDLRGVNEPKSQIVSFEYLIQTGSHWAGVIENGTVEFSFWEEIDENTVFSNVNDLFEVQNGKLVWNFTNLEPTELHDIQVSFDPSLLSAWAKRPKYIKSIPSSSALDDELWISSGIRTNEEMPGGSNPIGPYNLLLDDEHEWRGWLAETNIEGSNNWLNFTFNEEIVLQSVNIKTGILAGWPGEHYDTFQRPKSIEMTFSDGTTQTVILDDAPDKFQEITIENKETSSLKIAVQDTYEGVGGGNAYLGIGRIQLNADTESLNQELDESRVDDDFNNVNTNITLNTNTNTNLTNSAITNQQSGNENEKKDSDVDYKLIYIIIGAAFMSLILLMIIIK